MLIASGGPSAKTLHGRVGPLKKQQEGGKAGKVGEDFLGQRDQLVRTEWAFRAKKQKPSRLPAFLLFLSDR
jgi:hypothetical protein